jgi:hypothetical protein
MIRAALATYYLARGLTRLHGPAGAFERGRHAVYRARGFVRAVDGEWYHVGDAAATLEDDWLTAGVGCPVCAVAYVAPAVLLASRWRWGRAAVSALAVAGAATALWDRRG